MALGDKVSTRDVVSRPQPPATAHSPFPSRKLEVNWWGAGSFNFLDSCHVTHSRTEPSFHQPLLLAQASPYTSQVALVVKNPPAIQETQETQVRSLGQEDPLEEDTTTPTSILAWRIPQTEEPKGLQARSQRGGHG